MSDLTFTPFYKHADGPNQELTPTIKNVLVDLDWIINVGFEPLGRSDFFAVTDQGLDYVADGDLEALIASAKAHFPDVCAAHGLDTSILAPTPEPTVVLDEVMLAILAVLPDAVFDQDNEGQVIIYTDLVHAEAGGYTGRFNKPEPRLGEAPEGHTRLMVLDDGETYSGLKGCTILEVPAGYDCDDIERAFDNVNTDDEDENLAFVINFDENGPVV